MTRKLFCSIRNTSAAIWELLRQYSWNEIKIRSYQSIRIFPKRSEMIRKSFKRTYLEPVRATRELLRQLFSQSVGKTLFVKGDSSPSSKLIRNLFLVTLVGTVGKEIELLLNSYFRKIQKLKATRKLLGPRSKTVRKTRKLCWNLSSSKLIRNHLEASNKNPKNTNNYFFTVPKSFH